MSATVDLMMKLWGAGLYALEIQTVASLVGKELEIAPFTTGLTNRTASYLALSSSGTVRSYQHAI